MRIQTVVTNMRDPSNSCNWIHIEVRWGIKSDPIYREAVRVDTKLSAAIKGNYITSGNLDIAHGELSNYYPVANWVKETFIAYAITTGGFIYAISNVQFENGDSHIGYRPGFLHDNIMRFGRWEKVNDAHYPSVYLWGRCTSNPDTIIKRLAEIRENIRFYNDTADTNDFCTRDHLPIVALYLLV